MDFVTALVTFIVNFFSQLLAGNIIDFILGVS